MITKSQKMSDCWFEYGISLLEATEDAETYAADQDKTPMLFLERDYESGVGNVYTLFAVIPEWLAPKKEDEMHDRVVTRVRIGFTASALRPSDEAQYVELDWNKYRADGFRINVVQGGNDFSGAGTIELFCGGTSGKIKYGFGVNYVRKKKISYRLSVSAGQVTATFDNLPYIAKGIKLRLLSAVDRLPILMTDRNNIESERELTSSKKHLTFDVSPGGGKRFLLDIADQDNEQYYFLDCLDTGVSAKRKKITKVKRIQRCPYCHREITVSGKAAENAYKKGGISCQGKTHGAHLTDNGKPAHNVMFCEDDVDADPLAFKPGFERILPLEYMRRDNYKIAVFGAKRVGKSTYISRMFNIDINDKGDNLLMSMSMLSKALSKYATLLPYSMDAVADNGAIDRGHYLSGDRRDDAFKFYAKYAINMSRHLFPGSTEKDTGTDYKTAPTGRPFLIDVNGKGYAAFYDIAGEDAEQGSAFAQVINADGFILLVDACKDADGHGNVVEELTSAIPEADRGKPLAVVIAKLDKIASEFNPNCQCLRNDSAEISNGRYADSAVERNIEIASEEAESYLTVKGRDMSNRLGLFTNKKYFTASAFNFNEAIYHKDPDASGKEYNYLNFATSMWRAELPILWLLHQFGMIM